MLVTPGAPLLSLWKMARANLLDGTPMVEAAGLWDIHPLVIDESDVRHLVGWRRSLVSAWSKAVLAQVPLQAINLILVLPVIACIVVIFRNIVGIETFGTFAPVIVSLAFLMTGLAWGIIIFCVIVGVGVVMRSALQWLRIQLVARLAILIAIVSATMAALTVGGAYFGVGALLNVSIFPMVIMSNVIENFTTTQVESGTREALRLTINTLVEIPLIWTNLGEAGMALINGEGEVGRVPTTAREVYDVVGAGDTVTAYLATMLAGGATPAEAAVIANFAAGVEVAKLGAATVSIDEVIEAYDLFGAAGTADAPTA